MTPMAHSEDQATVFVVEDDADAARFACRALENSGYATSLFSDPDAALAALDRSRCSLLLSDVRLPGMTGLELLSQARQLHPSLPIVLMTAYYYDKDHVLKRSAANGLKDVVFKKPIKPARLIELIDARIGA